MKELVAVLIVLISVSSAIGHRFSGTFVQEIPTECPPIDDPNNVVHFPHEYDCTLFYKCSHGQKYLFHCPAGLHFSPTQQVCDHPFRAGCIPKDPPTPGNPETTTPVPTTRPTRRPTTTEPPLTTIPPTTIAPTTPEPTTTERPTRKPTTLPPTTIAPTTLPPTTVTSTTPKPTTTTRPSPVPTTLQPTTPEPTTTTRPTEKPTTLPPTTVPPTTPEPTTTIRQTQRPTTTELPTTVTTRRSTTTTELPETTETFPTTTLKPAIPTSCSEVDPNKVIYIPHECICTKFYRCEHGQSLLQECPAELHFNYYIQDCDFPEDAGCTSTPPPF